MFVGAEWLLAVCSVQVLAGRLVYANCLVCQLLAVVTEVDSDIVKCLACLLIT
jgi:hypothetical protein